MRRVAIYCFGLCALIFLGCAGLWGWATLSPKPALYPKNITWGQRVRDRNGALLHLALSPDGFYRLPLRRQEISPEALDAILRYEDQYFYSHIGVNPFSIVRAAWATITGPRPIGASTITMQLARRVQNLNTRSWSGKLQQILWALRYEAHYDKEEIITAYLSLVPYGGNIEGIKAASLIYFDTKPQELTQAQALALAVIPQNPIKRHPVTGPDFEKARQAITRKAIDEGYLSTRLRPIVHHPLKVRSVSELPFRAAHFTRFVEKQNQTSLHRTTLDLGLQHTVEKLLSHYVARLAPYGIENAATLVIDSRKMRVLAHVGSVDFFRADIAGEVDGTQAKRSPGSTLKPFLFGLALDQGLIHSQSILFDAPKNFFGYLPDNADRRYRGPIAATAALNESRNIPAVRLSQKVSPDFYSWLKEAGVDLPYPREHYGLSLILGGAEISMEKLARLYGALFHQGLLQKLNRSADSTDRSRRLILSPEAAWIVRQMLLDGGEKRQWQGKEIPIFWKTGTSNGFRDAWTAGAVGPYIVITWVGNFSGRAHPWLQGAMVAHPLFMEICSAVLQNPRTKISDQDLVALARVPSGVTQERVCQSTGDFARDSKGVKRCDVTHQAWFIPGVSPIRDTGIYQEILIHRRSGLRACRMGSDVKRVYYEVWPSLYQQFFLASGIHKPKLPAWDPSCRNQEKRHHDAPVILSPHAGLTYMTGTANKQKANIILQGSASQESHTLYWFVNDSFLGATPVGKSLLWEASPGLYTVTCVDNQGRSSNRQIQIRQP